MISINSIPSYRATAHSNSQNPRTGNNKSLQPNPTPDNNLPVPPVARTMENLNRDAVPGHLIEQLDSGKIDLNHHLLTPYFTSQS